MSAETDSIPIAAVKKAMTSLIEGRFTDLNSWDAEARQTMQRVKVHIEDLPAMQWLSCQTDPIKTYWANRNQEFRMAGIGIADIATAETAADLPDLVERLRSQLSTQYPHLRYYGGFQFDMSNGLAPEWTAFGSYRFIIPRFEVYRDTSGTYFACNFMHDPEDTSQLQTILGELKKVQFDLILLDWEERVPLIRSDTPNENDWELMIEQALADLKAGEYEKIVLARRATLEFSGDLDPVAYLLRLRLMAEDTFNFYFQPDEEHAFLGATPERLFRREGRALATEAIAGTKPRGRNRREDDRLGEELLHSDKELREHGFVVNMIHEELDQFCVAVEVDDEVSLTKLAHVQHLCRHFTAELNAEVGDADLLASLHPTPAIGGVPRDKALKHIADLEPFKRGWYAGTIGYVGHDLAEFVVAIRCALIEKQRLSLFSGAGIVRGSDPEMEWQEIEDKISKFLKALEF